MAKNKFSKEQKDLIIAATINPMAHQLVRLVELLELKEKIESEGIVRTKNKDLYKVIIKINKISS
jgi:hypothetical protein